MKDEIFLLTDRIRQAAFELHCHLRHGHLERVYENGIANRLRRANIAFCQQHPLQVLDDDGAILGNYCADLFVENRLIIEVKACKALVDEHTAQLLGYLRTTHVEHGVLINFGSPRLEIRKYALSDA